MRSLIYVVVDLLWNCYVKSWLFCCRKFLFWMLFCCGFTKYLL